MRPVLQEVADRGQVQARELTGYVADRMGLSEEDRAELVSSGNKTRVFDRVAWAGTYLCQAGLLERPRRAVLQITAEGRNALISAPDRITRVWLAELSPQFRAFSSGPSDAAASPGAVLAEPEAGALTPDEAIRNAHRQLDDALGLELIERLVNATPVFFEHTIRELLLKMGYGSGPQAADVVGGAGDDGVDGVVNLDTLGVDQVYFQAKRYRQDLAVGSGALRDFFGALALKDVTKGIFVTTARFSDSARSTAEKLNKRIVLIDGPELARLLIRFSVGCRVRDTFQVSEIEEDFFE
ncbi:restriction endonuclease [Pseudogemmobacter faecipullorum]|uniref:Restriction endonuclease n=1 Tax=Pseudogemmobacter faecipullorum TaxID=2755041 RepID=A0ABS8CKG3_9RHOB|nr:restriction endonuclease [Pseudogemmobacter faecipullorum]MCB5409881.1 restriction endonuclease [Pseudogemmobacter faecipullorum]